MNFPPLETTSLYKMLDICKASTRRSFAGIDYYNADAGEAFDNIIKMVESLGPMSSEHRRLIENLKQSKRYLKSDFKVHVCSSSTVADHCSTYALSDAKDKCFHSMCDHDHKDQCEDCILLKNTFLEIETVLNDTISDKGETERTISKFKNYHLPLTLPLYDGHSHIDLFYNYGYKHTDLIQQLSGGRKIVLIDNRHKYFRWLHNYQLSTPNATVYTTFGIHPKYIPDDLDLQIKRLEEIFVQKVNIKTKLCALGECGLDTTSENSYESQMKTFQEQLKLASKLSLPLVLHCRGKDLFSPMLKAVKQYLHPTHSIHWHCIHATTNLTVIFEYLNYYYKSYVALNGLSIYNDDIELQKTFIRWLNTQHNITERIILESDFPFAKSKLLQNSQFNIVSSITITAQYIVDVLRQKNMNTTKLIHRSNNNIRQMYNID
ncbi:unnamed protein product [Rotaria sp. Silwood2]|nr:unnamed protein product [Rotaria sp. Silwood2]